MSADKYQDNRMFLSTVLAISILSGLVCLIMPIFSVTPACAEMTQGKYMVALRYMNHLRNLRIDFLNNPVSIHQP